MDETDFHALHLRYRNAFEAYRALAARNADPAHGCDNPSIEQLRDEQQALDELAQARRELLSALAATPPQPGP